MVSELSWAHRNRTVPGYVDVLGEATNAATVTVNLQSTYRKGDYFRAELLVTNTSPLWVGITNIAVLNQGTNADIIATNLGNVFVPQTPETFAHDLDGNLTGDGSWNYAWDAENRATSFTRLSGAPSGAKVKLDCTYDYRSRRTQKIVSTWNGSTYVAQSTNKFVYDGWNLVAVLDGTNGLVQSFVWGTDASGTPQGAGGVGGLISMTVHQGTNTGTYFYCYDGNHNVVALVSAANSALAARYECDAFGNILRATGALAFVNPFVFSTKFCDWETGFYYYGYRFYNPNVGRWANRDMAEEAGGPNLYGFVKNNPATYFDILGMVPHCQITKQSDAHFDPATGNAYDLFGSWVFGTTTDTIHFYDGDLMTEQLKDTIEVSRVKGDFMWDLDRSKCGDRIPFKSVTRSLNRLRWYQHLGYAFNPLYGESIWYDLYHNPTRAFLGSFNGRADLIAVDCCKGEATVEMHVTDKARVFSATHTPLNYEVGLPNVDGPIGTPFRTIKLDFLFHVQVHFAPQKKNCCLYFYPSPNCLMLAN